MSNEDQLHPETGELAPVRVSASEGHRAETLPSGVTLRPNGGDAPAVKCVACDAFNTITNLHCEYCGARLPHRPWPNSQPKPATDAVRTLRSVAVGVALIAAIGALLWITNRGDTPTARTVVADAEDGTTQSTPPPSAFAQPQQITPDGVTASSEHNGFPADNLVDGDPASAWLDDSLGGRGAELTFTFGEQSRLVSITLTGIQDLERFHRNFRIRDFEIRSPNSDEPVTGMLTDEPGPQTVQLPGWETTRVILQVLTTYPAEPTGNQPGTQDLALNEVSFTGQPTPAG